MKFALSLARSAANPYDLVQTQLVNEGHPALWHLLLWTALCISDNAVVLKVVSIMVALLFSGLFFFGSPFPLPHRILFLCGHLPLYLYAVVARNYGISVVFLFLIAMEYSRPRRASPWIVGVCNALLANTNIYGAFCRDRLSAAAVAFQRWLGTYLLASWAIVVALTGLGGLLLAYTVWPAADDPVLANRYSAVSGSAKSNMGERLGQALLATCSDDRAWIAFMATGRDVYDLVGPTWAPRWPGRLAGDRALVLRARTAWRFPVRLGAVWRILPLGLPRRGPADGRLGHVSAVLTLDSSVASRCWQTSNVLALRPGGTDARTCDASRPGRPCR